MNMNSPEGKFNYRFKLFLNGGIRSYLSQMFCYDFNLKKDLDLAGDRNNLDLLKSEIVKLTANQTNNTMKDLIKQLNQQVNSIKQGSININTWKKYEESVLNFFNSSLGYNKLGTLNINSTMISEYKANEKSLIGYSYEHSTKTLRYYDSKLSSPRVVCEFNDEQETELKKIFPSLFENILANIKKSVGITRSMPIRKEQLIQLVTLGKNADASSDFNLSVDKSFLDLFNKQKEYIRLQEKVNKARDYRTLEDLTRDIITQINIHIDEFDRKTNNGDKEKIIMAAIRKYLKDGNESDFISEISKYQPTWFERFFYLSNKSSRTLKLIEQLRSSEAFNKQMEILKINPKIENVNKFQYDELINKYVYHDIVKNLNNYKTKVDEKWSLCKVTKNEYIKLLSNFLSYLNSEKVKDMRLPNVMINHIFPENGDNNEDNIINHITNYINNLKHNVENLTTEENKFYQDDCARIQNYIITILNYREEDNNNGLLFDETIQSEYNTIGENLVSILNSVEQKPKEKLTLIVSTSDVQSEISRMYDVINNIENNLLKFKTELQNISQTTFSNDIQKFITIELLKRRSDLSELREKINKIVSKDIDLLNNNEISQENVVDIIKKLCLFSTSLTERMSFILKSKNDGSERVYIPITNVTDGQSNFDAIKNSIDKFLSQDHKDNIQLKNKDKNFIIKDIDKCIECKDKESLEDGVAFVDHSGKEIVNSTENGFVDVRATGLSFFNTAEEKRVNEKGIAPRP